MVNEINGFGAPSPSILPLNATQQGDLKMEFLKLLLTQLKYQDPTQTVDSTQMIAQQAQFASLEQMQNLNVSLATVLAQNNVAQAASLLGKTVAGNDSSGLPVSGIVTGVDFTSGTPTLTVDLGGGATATMKLANVGTIGL
jgi:flagellar basal-body rod modification protein FlgD